jgi:spore coat polysaccharide biosynthesis protein SpsF (cytidylyltransferase family)
MKCLKLCKEKKQACAQEDCRLWVDYGEDFNCIHETVQKHGPLTLRETAERLGISFVRVKQIEDVAIRKLKKLVIKEF